MLLRDAGADDADILWLMLTHASRMDPPGNSAIPAAQADAYLASYVTGWQRPTDFGVVALGEDGSPLGAAWARLRGGPHPYRAVEADEPELAIAVLPDARGQGLGTRLLDGLIARAKERSRSLVLSVRADNAAVALYERAGFVTIDQVTSRVGTPSLVMRHSLGSAPRERT